MITPKDSFKFSARQWAAVEREYAAIMHLPADRMIEQLLTGADTEQKKYLAFGIMIGRMSR